MPNISLITTGGTIASKPNEKGLLAAGVMLGDEVASLCKMPQHYTINVVSLFQLPSMHITEGEMLTLKKTVETVLADDSVDGIVITHGTDSLEETAYFLDLTISDDRPIVLTGSQKSANDLGSDVYTNLRNAMLVAGNTSLHGAGPVVVFNERIWPARYVQKVHASNVQGFATFGYGYLGIIDQDIVHVYQKPVDRDVYPDVHTFPRVDIVTCYTGADRTAVDAFVAEGARGIIIEGNGRGHVPPAVVPGILAAIDEGTAVVLTTSAEEGYVFPAYDYTGSAYQLAEQGVILGKDYDAKKARVKLACALSSHGSPARAFAR
ncbi:asparaginase [Bacillaceae bacterium SIJ1]|uniref:asparaginase n=1 Tax=Litoribacterium kuwaitense TaxID=1398745 RepID=UPI0013EC3E66|nr:asparaginase [Litoribacterium kuwaitense]NGP43685.1 asparaginase [Litoribacterium kuwaitense]